MKHFPKHLLSLFTALLLALLAVQAQAGEAAPALIISYHVAPAQRPALRAALEHDALRQFETWKTQGLLKSYTLLFNRYADSDNWDALAQLSFAGPAELSRWQQVERRHPGGLPPKAAALTHAIHTTPVELARSNGPAPTDKDTVVLAIPYTVLVPGGDYLKYADGYVLPQFDGWMQEGVLSHYALYTASFGASRPWSTLILLAYRNDAALARRAAVVAKVRARLATDPAWKAISDNKTHVREERQVVVADLLLAPAAPLTH
jgi:hypothetical protein